MLTYGSKRFTWEHGRELASLYDGTTTWNYTYDADGMRTGRRSGSTAYTYVYNGSQLTQMTVGSNILRFTYEPDGKPFTVTFNGVVYYYMTNPQGDVVKILDKNGGCVVSYSYDAWGNPLHCDNPAANSVGALNPLRYRGYVYDTETGLYYLQSRYYNPEIGRFINADAYVATGQGFVGNNMFAYCLNNPICYTDKDGKAADSIGGILGEALGMFLYELFTGDTHPGRQAQQIENQVIQKQNEMLKAVGEAILDAGRAWWDAYQHSIELEMHAKYEQDMAVLETIEYFIDNPLMAIDAATTTVSLSTGYIGICATAGVISIPVVGQVVLGVVGGVCTLWGGVRLYSAIWDDLHEWED